MKYELFNDDCLIKMKDIPNNSIDLIITDPPYGVGFSKGFDDSLDRIKNDIDRWLKEMYRILKPTCHCYIFVPTKEIDIWISAVKKTDFNFMNLLTTRIYTQSVYFKNNFTYNSQLIIYCSKDTAKKLNKVNFVPTSQSWLKDKRNKNPHEYTYQYPSILDCFSNEKSTSKNNNKSGRHPCAKNIDFLQILINLSSNENDLILDPFMGGCSTGIACINTNRNFIGIELNENYFNLAKERIEKSYENKNNGGED